MNLVQELGVDYVRQRFAGCMFYDENGTPCFVNGDRPWARLRVPISRVNGTPENHTVEDAVKPESFFKDLSVFHTPPLGWRMNADGTYMAHLRRNNKSYQRALATRVIQRQVSPATSFLIDSGNLDLFYYDQPTTTIAMVMIPKFVAFREGVEAMRNGELFSFCVNPNLAVIPDVNDQQALLFNTTKVGVVKKNGDVVCDIPQVHKLIKDSIK